ncbi:hypothetical protein OL229_15620 [Neisseriaceae bacterium JH1-16]|nr:hypothetical protein [Neisseriaceae bacterium JH1-16]
MTYLSVSVRTALIVHGYDEDHQEIVEEVNETQFVDKLVLVDRIQSISAKYLLVTGSHGRVMYWEYQGGLPALRTKLAEAGLLIG